MEVYPESSQIYTYEDYQRMLEEMATYVREYRDTCIRASKKAKIGLNLVAFPITIMLAIAIGGGFLDSLGNLIDTKWLSYMRTTLEGLTLILIKVSDYWEFEKKKQKYTQAQALLTTFHNLIRQEIKKKRGYEGNREDIIKEFTEAFNNIKASNVIIQDLGIKESLSRDSSTSTVSALVATRVSSLDDLKRRPTVYGYNDAESESEVPLEAIEEGTLRKSDPVPVTIRRGNCNTALINDMLERM